MKTLARRRDTAELLRRLKRLKRDSTPLWGRMSAHQAVCHLSDACRMAAGEKAVSEATSLTERTLVKWAALYLPRHWPPGLDTRPEIDQLCGGTPPGEFEVNLAELETLVSGFSERPQLEGRVHPVFGRLSRAEWLRWAYLHVDHHLRQFGA